MLFVELFELTEPEGIEDAVLFLVLDELTEPEGTADQVLLVELFELTDPEGTADQVDFVVELDEPTEPEGAQLGVEVEALWLQVLLDERVVELVVVLAGAGQ